MSGAGWLCGCIFHFRSKRARPPARLALGQLKLSAALFVFSQKGGQRALKTMLCPSGLHKTRADRTRPASACSPDSSRASHGRDALGRPAGRPVPSQFCKNFKRSLARLLIKFAQAKLGHKLEEKLRVCLSRTSGCNKFPSPPPPPLSVGPEAGGSSGRAFCHLLSESRTSRACFECAAGRAGPHTRTSPSLDDNCKATLVVGA